MENRGRHGSPLARYVVVRSELIETIQEARDYYAERLVGDHAVSVRGVDIVVRFNAEEIHLFSEEVRAGSNPDASQLVWRKGRTGEVRFFARARARLLDGIIPTLAAPARVLAAKIPGGCMVVGPAQPAGWRLAVVIAPCDSRGVFFVRTAFPMEPKAFADAVRGRPAKWPP